MLRSFHCFRVHFDNEKLKVPTALGVQFLEQFLNGHIFQLKSTFQIKEEKKHHGIRLQQFHGFHSMAGGRMVTGCHERLQRSHSGLKESVVLREHRIVVVENHFMLQHFRVDFMPCLASRKCVEKDLLQKPVLK